MRVKVVPHAPESLDRLREIHRAIPLVPDDEESCCARLVRDAEVPAQDEAREWLTFCRALGLAARGSTARNTEVSLPLGLAEEGPRGFRRVRGAFDPDALAAAFRERVYAADEALAVLDEADGPVPVGAVFDRLRERVPAWERKRSTDWSETWTERIERVLDWAVLFGLAEREGEGYVRAGARR